jgi:hypothetical protein
VETRVKSQELSENTMIHALADLKATLKASVFFNDAQKMLRNANSFNALNAAAHLLDCTEFDELPKEARDDLDAQFRDKVNQITGGAIL